jgi:hypothetical protein
MSLCSICLGQSRDLKGEVILNYVLDRIDDKGKTKIKMPEFQVIHIEPDLNNKATPFQGSSYLMMRETKDTFEFKLLHSHNNPQFYITDIKIPEPIDLKDECDYKKWPDKRKWLVLNRGIELFEILVNVETTKPDSPKPIFKVAKKLKNGKKLKLKFTNIIDVHFNPVIPLETACDRLERFLSTEGGRHICLDYAAEQ